MQTPLKHSKAQIHWHEISFLWKKTFKSSTTRRHLLLNSDRFAVKYCLLLKAQNYQLLHPNCCSSKSSPVWDTFHQTENNHCISRLDATYIEKLLTSPQDLYFLPVLLYIDGCKHSYMLYYLCFILARVLPIALHTLFFCKADKYPNLYIKCLIHWNFWHNSIP